MGGNLDGDFLQHGGSVEGYSFVHILQTDIDTRDHHNQAQIVLYSHTLK